MLQVDSKQLAQKPRKIGSWNGKPVMALVTKGGLNMVVDGAGAVIGAGPHPAIARHIAKMKNPDIEFSELAKSEAADPAAYSHLLPKYEALTDRMRSRQRR